MHKIKNRTVQSSFLEKLNRIQQAFEEGITGSHKLNYAKSDFEFPLEVQQHGAT